MQLDVAKALRKRAFHGRRDERWFAITKQAGVCVQRARGAAEQGRDGLSSLFARDIPERDLDGRQRVCHRPRATVIVEAMLHLVHELGPAADVTTDECGGNQRSQCRSRGGADDVSPSFAPAFDTLIGQDAHEQGVDRCPVRAGERLWRRPHVDWHTNEMHIDLDYLHGPSRIVPNSSIVPQFDAALAGARTEIAGWTHADASMKDRRCQR
jgi:hypothetical protein